ncbi:MAG: HAD-IB family phosphatase [Candidatus Methanoplasma sp.]|jgi:phosphoserine phosphatase|nr:HAD-IB family phosphatase [Candidatus Methanoplasma sp.]
MRRYDLVCFDMDGVLTTVRSSWHWVNLCLGVDNEATYKAYVNEEIDESEFMRRDIAQWKSVKPGIRISDIIRFMQEMPLIGGMQETVACLRDNGLKCVIVSGGIDLAAMMMANEFGFDGYVAEEICSNPDGSLTGEGKINVDLKDKGINVRDLIEQYGTTKERTVSIGNSFTDIPMFRNSGMSIAFNPTDEFTIDAATHTVRSDNLADVLDLILPQEEPQSCSSSKSNPS